MECEASSRLKSVARDRVPDVSNTSAKVFAVCFNSSDAIARRSACSLLTE
jgi:hypothetical protein